MIHVHVDRCDSTQDVLKEQIAQKPNEQILVSCEIQTHGRGRGSNIWQDDQGTICFSMNIAPHISPSFTAIELTLLVSQFFDQTGQITKLKWPNDLLTDHGLKCGGILIQNSSNNYLAGIGINVFSLNKEYGGVFPGAFNFEKKKWSFEVASFINHHRYQSTEKLILDWQKKCIHLGETVRITDDGQEFVGKFLGIGQYGEAILEDSEGIKKIYNGSLRIFGAI